MNAERDKIRESLVSQLSSFEKGLDDKIDEIAMLSEIQDCIGRLLGNGGGAEAEIRRVLQARFETGDLRKETFQLVKSMLDRYVTECIPTSPDIGQTPGRIEPHLNSVPTDGQMASTMVMPNVDTTEPDSVDGRVEVGSILRDRFMLQKRVTGGSMGVVYKAMDRRLADAGTESCSVAIKILSPKLSQNAAALRALQQEAAKGRCLVHPNIVRFVDLDRDGDLYFIVMEWLEGRTLADILDTPDSGSIDREDSFKIVRQIGTALDYAHRCGVVHADVKPGNIMIAANGDAKLFDFGIARVRQMQLDDDPEFDPGVLGLLTPAYSSMQVLTGEQPAPTDDVFSLACLLYRLIAGYRVFGPRNAAEAADEGMKPQRLEKLSDANWRVLKKALSYSRVTRFDSIADFIGALDSETRESIPVGISAPARIRKPEETGGSARVTIGLFVLLALLGVVGNELGYLDQLKDRFLVPAWQQILVVKDEVLESVAAIDIPGPREEAIGDDLVGESELAVEVQDEVLEPVEATDIPEPREEAIVDELVGESELAVEIQDEVLKPVEAFDIPEPEVIAVPLVDFTKLPPPTAELRVSSWAGGAESVTITLREDGRPATVDLVRSDVEFPLTLRLEEVGFSGNRSPWVAGQYEFSGNGFIEFPVGQDRARVTLAMKSDSLREADRQSTLRIRESDTATSELAIINVVLEDDDQRAFEFRLPANTVAFVTSQVSVNERDPAAQLDIIRFNPDNTPLVVGYTIRDITATLGQDYFAPRGFTIEFGPGQRAARLLIPLVQDSEYEDNEAFSVELSLGDSVAGTEIYRRVAVMIRDDDQ